MGLNLKDGLVLHLSFSEGAPNITTLNEVKDKSRYQNHGTVVNDVVLVKPYEDDQESEGKNPFVVYDDDETIWAGIDFGGAGSVAFSSVAEETTEVEKGTSSAKIIVGAGGNDFSGVREDYGLGTEKDWSKYDVVAIWLYGLNDSGTIRIRITKEAAGANVWYYDITDNWSGWERKVIPLERFTASAGSIDWTTVRYIDVGFSTEGTRYLDRLIIDVGNWRFGEAAQFVGGNNEYIEITDDYSIRPTKQISIVAWIFPYPIAGNRYIICHHRGGSAYRGYMLHINASNYLTFTITNEGNADYARELITLGSWIHVVGVADDSKVMIYINGEKVNEVDRTIGNIVYKDQNPYIGNFNPPAYDVPLNGYIDELRIYKRALSAEEVRALYLMKVNT